MDLATIPTQAAMDPFSEIHRSCILTASQEEFLCRSHLHGQSVDDLEKDPFGEILRSCFLTASQEDYLRRSHFHGESVHQLATPSTAQRDKAVGRRITEASTRIFNCFPPHLEEDEKGVEEAGVSPSHVRQDSARKTLENLPLQASADKALEKSPLQTSADKTLEKSLLQTSADKTLEKSPLQASADRSLENFAHDVRQMSAEKFPAGVRRRSPDKNLGSFNEDAGRKRKSTFEIELGCPPESVTRKSHAGRIASEFLAKDQHSKSADGAPNALNHPPAQLANKDIPSDIHGDIGKNPSSNDAGPPVDELSNLGYNKHSSIKKFPSLKQFKEALGFENTNTNDVCIRRKLPPSIQGPSDENRGCSGGGGKSICDAKGFGQSRTSLLLNVAKELSKKSDHGSRKESIGTEKGSILEVAKQAGYAFPRPRWK